MKNRGKYHKSRNKQRPSSTTRQDVLLALEQQRSNDTQQEHTDICPSKRREIPGFFYDEEKKRYFPLSMKRDSVYDKPVSIPLKEHSLKKSTLSVPSVLLESKYSMQPSLFSSLQNSLFLSPHSKSISFTIPGNTVHGLSIVEQSLVVLGKSVAFYYQFNHSANSTDVAVVPTTVYLPPSFEVSFVHNNCVVCNSKEQSQAFNLSERTSFGVPRCRCCCVISSNQIVFGGEKGFFLYSDTMLSHTIRTTSAVMSLAASSHALFVGCRNGVVYRWDFKTRLLQWYHRCRHAVVAMAVMDDLVCTIDAAGIVMINTQRIHLYHAHCICQDEDRLLIGLRDQLVCVDWNGCVYSSLSIPNIRFLTNCDSFFALTNEDSQVRIIAKRGFSIKQTSFSLVFYKQTIQIKFYSIQSNSCA